jgi:hypothetical protein
MRSSFDFYFVVVNFSSLIAEREQNTRGGKFDLQIHLVFDLQIPPMLKHYLQQLLRLLFFWFLLCVVELGMMVRKKSPLCSLGLGQSAD